MDCITSTAIDYDEIPTELRDRPQWVCWRDEMRDGKPSKEPFMVNGEYAKSNDSTTWTTFSVVTTAYERGGFAGVGFMFATDGPFMGIDLDGCRDPATGTIDQWAAEIIDACDTYAEVSPSKTGVKLIGVGRSPFDTGKNQRLPQYGERGGKAAGIEVYDHGRYFTVTGWRLPETDREPCVIQPAALERVKKLIDEAKAATRTTSTATATRSTDTDRAKLVERCQKYIDKMPDAVSGQGGHNATFNVACVCFRFGLTDCESLEVMSDYNARCEPPWSDHDLQHKLTDARDDVIRSGEFGVMTRDDWKPPVQSSPSPSAQATGEQSHDPQSPRRPAWLEAFPELSPVELLEQYPKMRPVLIDGLLRVGEVLNLISASKAGKSWLVHALLWSVVTGQRWLDAFDIMRTGKVLLLDTELHKETLAYRIDHVARSLGINAADWADRFATRAVRGSGITLPNLLDLPNVYKPGELSLLVIDSFYKLIPPKFDENSNADMAQLFSMVDQLAAKLDCSVVLVHHSTKGSQSARGVLDVGAGAGSMGRATDSHWVLREHAQEGVYVAEGRCRSFATPAPRCLRWDFPLWRLADDCDPSDLKPERRTPPRPPRDPKTAEAKEPEWNAARFAQAFLGPFPQPKSIILANADMRGVKERTARKLIDVCAAAELVFEWPSGDKRKPLLATVRPPLAREVSE